MYRIANTVVTKSQFIKHLNSGYVLNVMGARPCKKSCSGIMYLEARLAMGNHYICDKGHEKVVKVEVH